MRSDVVKYVKGSTAFPKPIQVWESPKLEEPIALVGSFAGGLSSFANGVYRSFTSETTTFSKIGMYCGAKAKFVLRRDESGWIFAYYFIAAPNNEHILYQTINDTWARTVGGVPLIGSDFQVSMFLPMAKKELEDSDDEEEAEFEYELQGVPKAGSNTTDPEDDTNEPQESGYFGLDDEDESTASTSTAADKENTNPNLPKKKVSFLGIEADKHSAVSKVFIVAEDPTKGTQNPQTSYYNDEYHAIIMQNVARRFLFRMEQKGMKRRQPSSHRSISFVGTDGIEVNSDNLNFLYSRRTVEAIVSGTVVELGKYPQVGDTEDAKVLVQLQDAGRRYKLHNAFLTSISNEVSKIVQFKKFGCVCSVLSQLWYYDRNIGDVENDPLWKSMMEMVCNEPVQCLFPGGNPHLGVLLLDKSLLLHIFELLGDKVIVAQGLFTYMSYHHCGDSKAILEFAQKINDQVELPLTTMVEFFSKPSPALDIPGLYWALQSRCKAMIGNPNHQAMQEFESSQLEETFVFVKSGDRCASGIYRSFASSADVGAFFNTGVRDGVESRFVLKREKQNGCWIIIVFSLADQKKKYILYRAVQSENAISWKRVCRVEKDDEGKETMKDVEIGVDGGYKDDKGDVKTIDVSAFEVAIFRPA